MQKREGLEEATNCTPSGPGETSPGENPESFLKWLLRHRHVSRGGLPAARLLQSGEALRPPPNPLPQPSKRFAQREGSPGSQGESQGRLPTSCQASQKTVPGEGQAADCFTACSGSKSVPLANMAQATASSRSATDRKARAWLWPFSRSASYLARQIRSCCTATLLQ